MEHERQREANKNHDQTQTEPGETPERGDGKETNRAAAPSSRTNALEHLPRFDPLSLRFGEDRVGNVF